MGAAMVSPGTDERHTSLPLWRAVPRVANRWALEPLSPAGPAGGLPGYRAAHHAGCLHPGSHIEKFFHKVLKGTIDFIFTLTLTILITGFLTFIWSARRCSSQVPSAG